MTEDQDTLRAKLNAETGRLAWKELERHFARGAVVKVAGDLDLVEVALAVARDDKDTVSAWLDQGRLARADMADAQVWHKQQSVFWAVVAAPWVLVQEASGRLDA